MKGRILVVDDDRAMCELLRDDLTRRGHAVVWHLDSAAAVRSLAEEEFDVALVDLHLPGEGGLALCTRIQATQPDLPCIVITAFGSMETAIGAIRAGAYDFVNKPIDLELLALALARAIKHRALHTRLAALSEELARAKRLGELIGESEPMQRLFALLERVGPTDASVLLTGESGTGKELAARALHARHARHAGPFVAVNCGALPASLLESELFGHARGAFTDARSAHRGLFEQASGGTLLLDEIAELALPLQAALLRAIEQRTIRPVGAEREIPIDVRLVLATNRDLAQEVEQGRFRADLFYRINVIQLHLPALRERGADVLLLAQHFLEQVAARDGRPPRRLSREVSQRLLRHHWPGNVRELRNAMEHAATLARFATLAPDDLPAGLGEQHQPASGGAAEQAPSLVTLAEVERRHILQVLDAVEGNRTRAATVLGLDRSTLYRKLRAMDLPER